MTLPSDGVDRDSGVESSRLEPRVPIHLHCPDPPSDSRVKSARENISNHGPKSVILTCEMQKFIRAKSKFKQRKTST